MLLQSMLMHFHLHYSILNKFCIVSFFMHSMCCGLAYSCGDVPVTFNYAMCNECMNKKWTQCNRMLWYILYMVFAMEILWLYWVSASISRLETTLPTCTWKGVLQLERNRQSHATCTPWPLKMQYAGWKGGVVYHTWQPNNQQSSDFFCNRILSECSVAYSA
jgi:hypothetical protein